MSDSRKYEKGSDRDKHRRESSRKDYRDRSPNERNNHKRSYQDDSSSYRSKDRRKDYEGESHRSSDHRYEESSRRKNSRDDRSARNQDSRRYRDDERGQRNDHSRKRDDIDSKREKFDEARRKRRSEEENYEYGKPATEAESSKSDEEKAQAKKIEPDFKLSGNLSKDTNTYKGVVIKYSEPPEAKQPKTRWRLYVFKEDQTLPTIYIHRQSAFLLGRDRRVADIPIDHPSCSSQHAALQYRLVDVEKEDGTFGRKVKPYIIDLESTNGTYVNNNRIEPSRYVELKEKDMLKFGYSSREYILLHENSKDNLPESDTEENTEES